MKYARGHSRTERNGGSVGMTLSTALKSAEEIKRFCTKKYGVTFIVTEKINVKGPQIHSLYKWLTEKKLNSKFSSSVKWNFQKYLLNRDGELIDYFYSTTGPMSSKITNLIN